MPSPPLSRRTSVLALAKTLPQGQFTCPEDVKLGVPARRKPGGAKQQVIYKHAISTIIPEKAIDLTEAE